MRRANGRKQFRTKFIQNHDERMLEFLWKLQKRDEELINEFCSEIRVEKRGFKVWLHNNNKKENSRRPTVDILPECLIHYILCFLSFKEATQMSILSKTWLQAWSTLSNLKFRFEYSKGDLKIVDDIMKRYRDGKISIEKFELLENNRHSFFDINCREVSELLENNHHSFFDNCREVLAFPLIDKWLDIAITNGVKDLDLYLTSYSLPILTILAANSLRELVVKCCTLLPDSLSSVVVNCNSLRKLSLSSVSLNENMLQTLLNSCPLIESFIFEYCWGLGTFELVNLQKIKSVFLKVLEIRYCGGLWEIDAPNLVSLEYTWNQIPQLSIESRQLKHSKITLQCYDYLNDGWFCKLRKFLSNLPTRSQVCIDFHKYYEINLNNLQLDHRGSAPQLDVLNVYCTQPVREYSTFVDALLWSCHPRRLNLQSTRETLTFFVDHLMYMKNSRSKPWCSQLKEVKTYKFDRRKKSLHPVEHKSGKRPTRNLEKLDTYYILLDW